MNCVGCKYLHSSKFRLYDFAGWSYYNYPVTSDTVFGQTSNQTIYAQWTAIPYNLTLVTNGGTISNTTGWDTYTIDDNRPLPEPELEGTTFLGWYTDPEFTDESKVTSLNGKTGALTLYAKWDMIDITLNPNGGSLGQTTYSIQPGKSLTLPTPTRTGYSFGGWYNGDTKVNTTETFNQSTTLTAKWTPRIYTITLDDCGGTGGTGSYKSKYNNVLQSSVNVPEFDGYTFAGYFSKQDGQGTQYYNEKGRLVYYYGTSVNTTVYAYWVPTEYIVTLELNGGTLAENSSELTYTYGTGAELPNDAEKTGYVFAGWYSNSEFTGSPVTEIPETASGDKTFYAKWEPNRHSVNVNAVLESGGLIAENLNGNGIYSYGDTVSVSAVNLLGYEFKGWYKSDGKDGFTGNILSENPEYSFELMDENVSVTAVYAQKSTDDRLQLEVNGMAFKINGGKTQYGHCVLKYNAGTEITIEYIDKTQNFYY